MDIHEPPPPHQRHYNLIDDDGLFGDFPPSPPDDSITPQATNIRIANPQSQSTTSGRIRFADDTRLSPNRSSNNQVLVLGGSSSSSNLSPNRPSSTHKMSEGSNSLDFSMITTPGGGGKQRARMVHNDYSGNSSIYTPSDFNTTNNTAAASSGRFSSILRGVVSSTPNIDPRQLLSSSTKTPYTAARESYMTEQQSTNDDNNDNECTALQFAKTAPLSGYLRKLGTNIPTFKRRFFVLKPSTHLYYFVSPNDIEPRGCIDLDMIYDNDTNGNEGGGGGCEVREIGVLADGTFRFELLFDEEVDLNEEDNASTDTSSRTSDNSSRRRKRRNFQRSSIVLEARTEQLGREWMTKLQSERLSIAKNEVECLTSNLDEMKSISSRWETSACEEAMRADTAERQRNTAISEAKNWETKFNNLNEAIRLLVRNDIGNGSTSSEFLSEAIAGLDLNDTNFSDVSEAFQTLNSKCNLASKRDEEVNARIVELEQEIKNAESRATKAETELVKVWEDNGTLQDDLKKTRREKRILVKEVKSLQAAAEENASKQQCAKQQQENSASHIDNERHDLRSTNSQSDSRGGASDTASSYHTQPRRRRMNDDEKRLVIELEEHVMSGLRLSEQFLTLNGVDPSEVGDYDIDNSSAHASTQASTQASKDRSPERQSKQGSLSNFTPHTPAMRVSDNEAKPLGSLLDDNDDDESEVALADSTTPHTSNKEIVRNHSDIAESTQGSSILNDIFLYEQTPSGDNHIHVNQNLNDRFNDTTRQQRESNHLNSEDQPIAHSRENSTVASSSVSESSRSRITDNGHATTKLECPLRDVGETSPHRTLGDDGNVYHITFYTKKIGLQFQKVPNETKPGLLTDAMTADHGPNIETNQTAAELRRIASISQNSHNRKHRSDDLSLECLPITPVDAVLVCGFIGFDESNGNVRPRIGARLVAFDGIPVEVGKWTFESIRKSIQARGRPLTLSFRNDFLTSRQREILTKAVADIGQPEPPQSLPVSSSRGNAYIIRERNQDYHQHSQENTIYRSTSSISSQRSQPKRYYSFSEAGSSISNISSAVAPLVSNLLSKNSRSSNTSGKQRAESLEPDYMKRSSSDDDEYSIDKMKHHRHFQSGLL